MATLHQDFGITASYGVCLRARNKALELIYGGYGDSFKKLPGYLHMLRRTNPGSIIDYSVSPHDGRFQHLFVALAPSIAVFQWSVRPVIIVDGAHLKGKNQGILFVAVTKDGNDGVVPLAWGIGPIENDIEWIWFLSHVRVAFGCRDDLLIVSDGHPSIANAVSTVYPGVPHGLCYFHILKGLVTFGKPITKLYNKAAFAYRRSVYEKAMKSIRAANPTAYNKLDAIGPERWALSFCPVRRYGTLTSNWAEAFNKALLWARRLPICSCLEAIRIVVEKWFDERRVEAVSSNAYLTNKAHEKLTVQVEKARSYTTTPISAGIFKVNDGINTWTVDLNRRCCPCRVFDMDLIPCSHAVAAIQRNGQHVYAYVDPFYMRTTMVETYAQHVNDVPPPIASGLFHNILL